MKYYSKRSASLTSVPWTGAKMPLDRRTPHGLFEDDEGNRYVVALDEGYGPLAIVFRHRFVPVFTWHVLTRSPIGTGRWWGPYRVRLTSSVGWDHNVQYPGVVSVMGETLSIDCHYGLDGGSVMPLGDLREDTGEVCDAESWTIEAVETQFSFCTRSRLGKLDYGATPLEPAIPGKRDFVVELDPRSVLNSN